MGAAAARAVLGVSKSSSAQLVGAPHLKLAASSTRRVAPQLRSVSELTRSKNINRNPVIAGLNLESKMNISNSINSTFNTNDSIVTRAGMSPTSVSAHTNLGSFGSRGLASVSDSESASSSPSSAGDEAKDPSPNTEEKKARGRAGVFAAGFGIFSTVLSYIIKLCGGGYTPYVEKAEKDIEKAAELIEEGAEIVVKLADEIEAIAHVADMSAQEAENIALKVEAKTKVVKKSLDNLAAMLEGDKNLSTVLSDYAAEKKESTLKVSP